MKKTINIFVAGAKDLKNERNALKALAHELNTSYEDRKININLKIRSYEDFRDNQIEYNNFIENEADVAIFVLKDRIGKHTEEEFINAASAFNRKKIPEIIVFLNKDRKETQEVAHIQELLQEHLGNHYFVEYSDDDDLKAKARKRIDRFIRPTFRMNSRATIWALTLTTLCAVVFAGLFAWSCLKKENKNTDNATPSILFVGGGSVVNYIKEITGVDIRTYENSIFASMPSGNAYSQIAEEYNRFINSKTTPRLPFRTIILSADKVLDLKKMLSTCRRDVFENNASIVECYLGDDSLVVWISNEFFDKNSLDNDVQNGNPVIHVNSLKKLLQGSVRVFATSKPSGTRHAYNKYLNNNEEIDISEPIGNTIITFNEADDIKNFSDEKKNTPYIILCSTHYYPKHINDDMVKKYLLVTGKDNELTPATKKYCLYFVVFKEENYKIAKPIYDFIKLLSKKNPKIKLNNNITNDTIVQASHLLVPLYK